jgi:hypothetical protein
LGSQSDKKAGMSVPTNSSHFKWKASCNMASVDESLLKTERQCLFMLVIVTSIHLAILLMILT